MLVLLGEAVYLNICLSFVQLFPKCLKMSDENIYLLAKDSRLRSETNWRNICLDSSADELTVPLASVIY